MDLRSYELVEVASKEDWDSLHELRRQELFSWRPNVVYDSNHPDDHSTSHFPLVLKLQDKVIGTARLDLLSEDSAALRLVAIEKELQHKGHGRILMQLFEDYARAKGIEKLYVNAFPGSIGFYERLGFVRESWLDPNSRDPKNIQMSKSL